MWIGLIVGFLPLALPAIAGTGPAGEPDCPPGILLASQSLGTETARPGPKPRQEVIEAFATVGARAHTIASLWHTTTLRDLPDDLAELAKKHFWPAEQTTRLYSVLCHLGATSGWSSEQIESSAVLLARQAFGEIVPEGHSITVLSHAFVEPNEWEQSSPVGQERQVNLEATRVRLLLDSLKQKYGGLPPASTLPDEEVLPFTLSRYSLTWLTRHGPSMLEAKDVAYLKRLYKRKIPPVGRALILLTDAGRDPAPGKSSKYFGPAGWLHLGDRLGIEGYERIYNIARMALGETVFARLEWPKPESRTHYHSVLAKRAKELALGRSEDDRLAGVLEAAIRLGVSPEIAYRVIHGSSSPFVTMKVPTVGMLFYAKRWLQPTGDMPLEVYRGTQGMDELAWDYFDGDRPAVYSTYKAVLGPEEFAALQWPAVRLRLAPPPAGRPFKGMAPPPPFEKHPNPMELPPEQKTVAQEYLVWWLRHEKHPKPNQWGKGKGRIPLEFDRFFGQGDYSASGYQADSAYFYDPDQAVRAVSAVASARGIYIDWLDASLPGPPTPNIRKHWQDAAVHRYLQWIMRNPGRAPSDKDWGTRKGQIPLLQDRFYGEGAFFSTLSKEWIFDGPELAHAAIRERAEQLGIPLEASGRSRLVVEVK